MGYLDIARDTLKTEPEPETMEKPLPYLDEDGDLVIPINSDPRFWWWAGGMSIKEILLSLKSL